MWSLGKSSVASDFRYLYLSSSFSTGFWILPTISHEIAGFLDDSHSTFLLLPCGSSSLWLIVDERLGNEALVLTEYICGRAHCFPLIPVSLFISLSFSLSLSLSLRFPWFDSRIDPHQPFTSQTFIFLLPSKDGQVKRHGEWHFNPLTREMYDVL